MAYLDCQQKNPARPVDWRWRRAEGIVSGTQPPAGRTRDGSVGYSWIRKAVRLRNALQNADADSAAHGIMQEYDADTYWAHHIHSISAPYVRHALQAYLMTQEEPADIAYAMAIDPGVVSAYEALFFNVRERLHNVGYIVSVIFNDSLYANAKPLDMPTLWKLYAWCYGAPALESVMRLTVNPSPCNSLESVAGVLQGDAIGTMKLKAAMAAKTVGLNGHTQLELLKTFAAFVEIERTTDSEGQSNTQLMESIAAMLTGLPFDVNGERVQNGNVFPADRGALGQFDHMAAELTYTETMRVAVGEPLPHSKALQRMRIPTARTITTEGGT